MVTLSDVMNEATNSSNDAIQGSNDEGQCGRITEEHHTDE